MVLGLVQGISVASCALRAEADAEHDRFNVAAKAAIGRAKARELAAEGAIDLSARPSSRGTDEKGAPRIVIDEPALGLGTVGGGLIDPLAGVAEMSEHFPVLSVSGVCRPRRPSPSGCR